jgi:hypothetical protein
MTFSGFLQVFAVLCVGLTAWRNGPNGDGTGGLAVLSNLEGNASVGPGQE